MKTEGPGGEEKSIILIRLADLGVPAWSAVGQVHRPSYWIRGFPREERWSDVSWGGAGGFTEIFYHSAINREGKTGWGSGHNPELVRAVRQEDS